MGVEAAGGTRCVLGEARSILFAELAGLHKWSAQTTKSRSLQALADSRFQFGDHTCDHAGTSTTSIDGQLSTSFVYLQAGNLTFVLLVLVFSTAEANSRQTPRINLLPQMISMVASGLKVIRDLLLQNQQFHVVLTNGGTKVFHSYKLLNGLLSNSRVPHGNSHLDT